MGMIELRFDHRRPHSVYRICWRVRGKLDHTSR